MGLPDMKIGLDKDGGGGLTGSNAWRLRFAVAWAGIPEGETEVPAEEYFDVHGTDDVPVTARDFVNLDFVCDYAWELSDGGAHPENCGPALAVADAFWPGIGSWIMARPEADRAAFLERMIMSGDPNGFGRIR